MLQITPKLVVENIFGHYFGLHFLNHQLRAITNLGPHTLQKRFFYKFKAINGNYFFRNCYCVTDRPRWKDIDFVSLGRFFAPNFDPKVVKNAYIGYKVCLVSI